MQISIIITFKAVFGSRKSISEKYSIFRKCYFPKRKIFLCIWLYFKKFSKKYFLVFGKCYKEKDKTRKTNTAPRLTLTINWVRRHAPVRRPRHQSRSREAPRRLRLARRWVRDLRSRSTALVLANDADWSLDVRTALTGSLSPSRSLSLPLRNSFEVKIGTEIHFRSQSLFFWVNRNQFSENRIFRTNQTSAFPEKHFRKWFSPKTNAA